MGSSSRSLELKLMGCKGLQAFNFFQKLKVFAIVSLTSDNPSNKHNQQQQRTKTDTEGDKDPEWNQDMRFDLDTVSREDYDHLYLQIVLHYEFFGDKSLGEVRVPLTDLVSDGGKNCGVARFVSYEVRTHENKPNGFITFSYKVVNTNHGIFGSATGTTTIPTGTASNENNYGGINGYTVVNHVNDGLLQQQQQQNQNQNQNHHQHQSDHDNDQNSLQSAYGRADQEFSYQYSRVESTAYGAHYPSMETPSYFPTPEGEGYMSYLRFDHNQYQYPPPPPPPHLHPPSHPFPPPPPPPFHGHPFPPPQPSDQFPPPQPPFHHVGHGAVYPPPPPGDPYEHSYSMSRNIYYDGDGTPRY